MRITHLNNRQSIYLAAQAIGARVDIDQLSSTGFRVKLFPSHLKTIKVEAGERIYHRLSAAERLRLQEAWTAFAAAHNLHNNAQLYKNGLDQELLSQPELRAIAEKLLKGIHGTWRQTYKKVAPFMRKATDSERAIGAVCWHGFRDFFIKLFELEPQAHARTAFAFYKGKDSFLKLYPETAYRNIGSRYSPCNAEDACFCGQEVSQ